MAARHGTWCNSRTFPMTCKYCGERIFYFTCDHGSRVLFDELGPPWPRHECIEYQMQHFWGDSEPPTGYGIPQKSTASNNANTPYAKLIESLNQGQSYQDALAQIRQHLSTLRDGIDDIEQLLDDPSFIDELISSSIDPSYTKKIQKANQQKRQADIIRQDPYGGLQTEEEGIVRELIQTIDVLHKLRLPDTPVTQRMMEKYLKRKYAQITIHTGALGDEDRDSFTVLVEQKRLKRLGIIIGDYVRVHIEGIQVLDRDPFWIVNDITTTI